VSKTACFLSKRTSTYCAVTASIFEEIPYNISNALEAEDVEIYSFHGVCRASIGYYTIFEWECNLVGEYVRSPLLINYSTAGKRNTGLEKQIEELNAEKTALKEQLVDMKQNVQITENHESRIADLFTTLETAAATTFEKYDDRLVLQIVDKVVVHSAEKISVEFLDGMEVEAVLV